MKTKTKHTPGPWSVYDGKDWIVIESTEQAELAQINKLSTIDSGKSNARLIAAAPELLEALEKILIHFNKHEGRYAEGEIEARQLSGRVFNLINKATGGAE